MVSSPTSGSNERPEFHGATRASTRFERSAVRRAKGADWSKSVRLPVEPTSSTWRFRSAESALYEAGASVALASQKDLRDAVRSPRRVSKVGRPDGAYFAARCSTAWPR